MARDLSLEPAFPTSDIQGDILAGLLKRHEHLVFFRIADPAKFRAFLKTLDLTSMQECLDKRAAIKARKDKGDETVLPTPGLNVAFTFKGLTALNVPGIDHAPGMDAFRARSHVEGSGARHPRARRLHPHGREPRRGRGCHLPAPGAACREWLGQGV